MPNGGSDNCGECAVNQANVVGTNPRDGSYCLIRHVKISVPFYTYCVNFTRRLEATPETLSATPMGSIYADAIGYPHARIPWNGDHEPCKTIGVITCATCGWRFEKNGADEGLEIETAGGSNNFVRTDTTSSGGRSRIGVKNWSMITGGLDHIPPKKRLMRSGNWLILVNTWSTRRTLSPWTLLSFLLKP